MSARPSPAPPSPVRGLEPAQERSPSPAAIGVSHLRLGALVFVAGGGTLATEIAASRLLAPYFGSSTAVWANIIGLILVYLSVGYWLGGKLADRRPEPRLLGGIVLVAAAFVAATPFAAQPLLNAALHGFASISVGAVVGSFFGALALFAVPVTLLGTVSPFAVRLALTDVAEAGRVAGRLYALSTVGSILGTFISALVAIELVGTRRTMVGTAALLAAAALPLAGRRGLPVAVALGALLLLPAGTVKHSSGLLYEAESPYQYVQVVRRADGSRALQLNEGVAVHSLWRPGTVFTGGYWDLFLLLPRLLDHRAQRLLVIGNAGGTVARAYGRLYPGIAVDGVEIDPEVSAAGRRFFEMLDNRRLHVVTSDGRTFLRLTRRRYDIVIVDAYRQPYIPFHLATVEFFTLVRDHLRPGGLVALNVAAVPGDRRLTRALGTTLLAGFPQAWSWPALRFNDVLIGLDRPATRGQLVRRARRTGGRVGRLVPLFAERLAAVRAEGDALTDDRAPVEWLTDAMIVHQIARGAGPDDDPLPTLP